MRKITLNRIESDLLEQKGMKAKHWVHKLYELYIKDLIGETSIPYLTESELYTRYNPEKDKMIVANCIYGTERPTVPVIYMDNQKVGGYGELYQMHKEGTIKSVAPTLLWWCRS